MNRQIYKMTLSDASDSITFYLLEVPIADDDITGTARNTTIDGNVYEDYLWLKKQWSQKWSIMCKDEYDKLRGIWKRQYTDSEVVSVKYFYGDNIYTDGEVEGNTMQINNDSEVYEGEIRGFSLYGNATQQTYTGKNLLPIVNTTRTIGDVKFTPQADGSVLVNGTNTSGAYITYVLTQDTSGGTVYRVVPAVAGTYYISNEGTLPSGVYVQCFTQITGQSVVQYNADRDFTIASDFGFGCSIRVDAGTTVNNLIVKPMVEKSATKTSWEQYCGGTPAPNPDFPQVVNTVSGEQTVNIAGKNLWGGLRSTYSTTASDVDFTTYPDGSVYANGTSTAVAASSNSSAALQNGLYITIPAGTYTVSGTNPDLPLQAFNVITGDILAYSGHPTFTLNETTSIFVRVRLASGTTVDGTTYIQLERNNQATAFEPHQSQSYEINLGKNLFSPEQAVIDSNNAETFITPDGKWLQFQTGGNRLIYNFPQKAGTTFTITTVAKSIATGTNGFTFQIYYADGTTETIITQALGDGAEHTNTATKTLAKDMLYFRTGYTDSKNAQLKIDGTQLEMGSQATPYAPYKTPIELAKIGTYRDYIWNDDGTWKIHKEVGKAVLDGTQALTLRNTSANNTYTYSMNTPFDYKIESGALAISDHFSYLGAVTGVGSMYDATKLLDKLGIALYYNSSFPTSSSVYFNSNVQLPTWLGTHNTTVYYALATPTDTEITDAELVGQLNALLAGSLYKGLSNVFLIPSAGADGTMTLDYRINYEKETVVQDTTPVLLDLTDDGIINACQCRQNVKITMRETVQ